jgi:hypothetical protein
MATPFDGVWNTVRYQTMAAPVRETIRLTIAQDTADPTRLDGHYAAAGFDAVLHGVYDAENKSWMADIREGAPGAERFGLVQFALSDDETMLCGAYVWSNIGMSAPFPWWGTRA